MTQPPTDWDGSLNPLDFSHVALVVAFRQARKIDVGQVSLGQDVAGELRDIALEANRSLSEMDRRPWTSETAWERNELRVILLSQLDQENAVVEALSSPEFEDLPLEELRDRSLIFYAIVIGPQPADGDDDVRRFFLRKTNPRLGAERKLVTLLSGDELTRITEPLFTFDRRIDLVFVPGAGVLAVNEGPFDILFRDTPELLAKTPEHARTLAAHLPLRPGSEEVLVSAAVRYARVRRRVLAAVERGHLVNVTPEQLRSELERQGLDPSTNMRNGQLSVTDENVLDLVRVLNEDLLTGGLSGQRFEIERKSAL